MYKEQLPNFNVRLSIEDNNDLKEMAKESRFTRVRFASLLIEQAIEKWRKKRKINEK